jgi:uncharacterized protein (DUF2147 family)
MPVSKLNDPVTKETGGPFTAWGLVPFQDRSKVRRNQRDFSCGTGFPAGRLCASLRLRKRRTCRDAAKGGHDMLRTTGLALAAIAFMAGPTLADPIEGNWKTASGSTAAISGGGSFTITLKSGKFAGKTIGSLKPSGSNKYAGSITDPETDKTYSGKATLSGTSLKMSGCVLGGLICKSQTWTKL